MSKSQEKLKELVERNLSKYPWTTTIIAFNMAIYWKGYSNSEIRKYLKVFVDKSDYTGVPFEELAESCIEMTNEGLDKIVKKSIKNPSKKNT